MTRHGDEYDRFTNAINAGTLDNIAPGERFGRYLHNTLNQKQLRETREGREHLLGMPVSTRGRSHEKESDIAPFVAWDGEGITFTEGMPQQYVLFGSSTGHMVQGENLPTRDCLETIIQCERDNPAAIHVGFAFKYDAEMILKDISTRHWMVLHRTGSVSWEGYTITYHPGRLLRITRKDGKQRTTATIYDVWGMFQGSFVNALRTWLDESELAEIDRIEVGKALRGKFAVHQIDSVIAPYWRTELRLLVVLCDRLRERLTAVDLCPRQWHGAGAVASTVYRRHRTREHQARTDRDRHPKDKDLTTTLPKEVNEAARYAYAGGRFELFGIGHVDRTVYQYDINSAYPNAISHLPSLKDAEWEHRANPRFDPSAFALWHVEYADYRPANLYSPGPLFHRDYEGKVSFPSNVSGWYWTPEAACVAANPHARITDAWICHSDGTERPFAFVRDLYDERRQRKANRDPSEKALKLALNSLYGKMAQRLGYRDGDALPRFHQLEWAGWVTSYTRAMLYGAMREAGSDLVAVETDAVFSLRPLQGIQIGTELGLWEETQHDWMTYLQSGTYWSNHGAKYRGFDRDSLSHDDAMRWLARADWSDPLVGTTTRFIGSGTGLGSPLHRTWVTDSRDMQPGRAGKRVHVAESCLSCATGDSPASVLHPMICIVRGGTSFPHALPWIPDGSPGVEWQELQDIERWSDFG